MDDRHDGVPSPEAVTAALDDFLRWSSAERCGDESPHGAMTLYEHGMTIAPGTAQTAPSAYTLQDNEHTMILDSGASSHFTVPELALTEVRPCVRTLRAAGGTVLHGTQTGKCGALQECITVEGLTASLSHCPSIRGSFHDPLINHSEDLMVGAV